MKTIDLADNQLSAGELLDEARGESVIVKAADGTAFVLSAADALASEVELLRRNQAFLARLDELKRDRRTVSLEEMEQRLK